MSKDVDRLEAVVDEALRDLTSGAPREGFRGRVMARIAATPEPVLITGFEIFGLRLRSFQLAAVGTVAALGLVAALVIPSLFRQAGPTPAETSAAAQQEAAEPQATTKPAPTAAAVQHVAPANSAAQFQSRRSAAQRVAAASATRAADDDAPMIPSVKVDLLLDPSPIVNNAIEIRPVEIQPLAIPEIQVPTLDSGGAAKSPGPGK